MSNAQPEGTGPFQPFAARVPLDEPPGPLHDVRVLDLSRVLAGPFAAMTLGDMGADVIKVEQPGEGDETRLWGPPFAGGESAYFLAVNRNKRSITLNLKHPDAQTILLDLVRKSDVLIENFKTGTLERLGLDDETLWRANPGLIHAAITGFGTTGPYADYAGYDFVVQGMAGIMAVTGEDNGEPMKVGIAIVDITAGLFTVNGILAALYSRHSPNEAKRGQRVDVSLLQAAMGWLANVGQNYLVSGVPAKRYGNAHPNIVPYQVFAAKDRPIALASANPRQFRRFCELAGRPDLADDARFRTNADRLAHRDELIAIVQELIATKTADDWMQVLNEHGVPAGPINTLEQAFADPQVRALGIVGTLPHPTAGDVPFVGSPIGLSATPVHPRTPPPLLGADTESVLTGMLGLSAARVQQLRDAGAIKNLSLASPTASHFPPRRGEGQTLPTVGSGRGELRFDEAPHPLDELVGRGQVGLRVAGSGHQPELACGMAVRGEEALGVRRDHVGVGTAVDEQNWTVAMRRPLAAFRGEYWVFYLALPAYQSVTVPAEAARLGATFDALFKLGRFPEEATS